MNFKKKFKVRTTHYAQGFYCIEYCNYRIIQIWHILKEWHHILGWKTDIGYPYHMEMLAKKLQSMNDINQWYEQQNQYRTKWLKEAEEIEKKNSSYGKLIVNK